MAGDEFNEPFQEVLDDHEGLLTRVGELEREEDTRRIGERIVELVPLLQRHFEREERPGGMFEHVEARDPRHAGQIRELREDHAEILRIAEGLLDRLPEAASGRAAEEALLDELRGFCTHVRRHEAKENALLADSLYHEEGGGD